MIVGIGMDLVEVERVERLLRRHPERAHERLFTAREVAICLASRRPGESFAARFAAKEALFKALGCGWSSGASWREVEILREESGAPSLLLHAATLALAERKGVRRLHITLSHTDRMAGAYVVLEG